MTGTPHLAVQASLFGAGEPEVDHGLTGLVRHDLDERSWVDHVPGWLSGDDTLFAELERSAPWRQRQRQMWDTVVEEPRLVALYYDLRALPPVLDEARRLLSARYKVGLDSCLVNLYRDGRDSVAWHGDTVRKRLPEAVVVTISLGARRAFHVRPRGGGGTVLTLHPGAGDLVVMGGRMQHEWEHTVPKTARVAGPRMSVTMRHSRPVATPSR
ncbi:MAG: alpha-ketoglutarate-dependent dioxygenase AlkB [Actinomycetota bacterium]|nr:alpha-ketoglutarate-dependent dioxygenase AlkB [Actinomycetota bacterium]